METDGILINSMMGLAEKHTGLGKEANVPFKSTKDIIIHLMKVALMMKNLMHDLYWG